MMATALIIPLRSTISVSASAYIHLVSTLICIPTCITAHHCIILGLLLSLKSSCYRPTRPRVHLGQEPIAPQLNRVAFSSSRTNCAQITNSEGIVVAVKHGRQDLGVERWRGPLDRVP